MRIGTRSVLFGYHQPLIHTWFVATAWIMLFGFPWNWMWVAFFVHDIGYWGKPNMDGPEGETHPEVGARLMSVFGQRYVDEVLLHSRYYADRLGRPASRLCLADKLAICMTPYWLWKLLMRLSGEWREYAQSPKYMTAGCGPEEWLARRSHAVRILKLLEWISKELDEQR